MFTIDGDRVKFEKSLVWDCGVQLVLMQSVFKFSNAPGNSGNPAAKHIRKFTTFVRDDPSNQSEKTLSASDRGT